MLYFCLFVLTNFSRCVTHTVFVSTHRHKCTIKGHLPKSATARNQKHCGLLCQYMCVFHSIGLCMCVCLGRALVFLFCVCVCVKLTGELEDNKTLIQGKVPEWWNLIFLSNSEGSGDASPGLAFTDSVNSRTLPYNGSSWRPWMVFHLCGVAFTQSASPGLSTVSPLRLGHQVILPANSRNHITQLTISENTDISKLQIIIRWMLMRLLIIQSSMRYMDYMCRGLSRHWVYRDKIS